MKVRALFLYELSFQYIVFVIYIFDVKVCVHDFLIALSKPVGFINQILSAPIMKIDLKDIILLYENIQQQLRIEEVSVVIFTAIDIDSICTLKIFLKMFKNDNINYKKFPVTTFSELNSRIEEARLYDQVKVFMFINCGGAIDLTDTWIVQQKQAQIFLFDVNKPINHKNLQNPDIKIVDDGYSDYDICPTSEEIQKYEQLNEYNLQDEDEDDVFEQKVGDSPKRSKKHLFMDKLRKHKDLLSNKITNYYGKHFFGYPSSYFAYRMVRDMSKANNDFLWYAIIGATSMFLQHKITKQVLDFLSQTFRAGVSAMNVMGIKRQKGDIAVKKGFQFSLMDHWSLFQSIMNSPYMMTRFHLWDEKGVNKLYEFIHTLEISLQQAKQLFKYMSRESQNKLENNIYPTAEKFKVLDVVYMSFIRQVDYADAYMASDFYYMLTSVLESPPPAHTSFEMLPEYRISCFWKAYDAIDCCQKDLLPLIQNSKRMMRIMMTETKNIIERDHLITMPHVTLCTVRNDTDDKKIFQHPSTLIRLAYLLMGIVRQIRKSKQRKPFVANWLDLQKEICTCVGVMMDSKSTIGLRFTDIAERLNIQVNHDNFMSNILVMKKEHLTQFIKEVGVWE